MKNYNKTYSNPKQAVLPMLISDYLDICDPVLTFDRFMEEIELEKYLKSIPKHYTGRLRYNPVSMLKTVLLGFMTNGYISLRELEDQCKVNLRFMYLMEHETPSYRTFGYFINEVIGGSIEEIFNDINQKIFEKEHVDLQHLYIDGSKFEANANKYSWVWKKATEKSRYRLFDKILLLALMILVPGFMILCVNGAQTYFSCCWQFYVLFLGAEFFDWLVIDTIWVAMSDWWIIPGMEDLNDTWHSVHVKQWKMLKLILLAIPVSAIIGALYWGIRVLTT